VMNLARGDRDAVADLEHETNLYRVTSRRPHRTRWVAFIMSLA
jgi:hypothetical protein